MAEGAADQERQPIISKLFPIGENSVSAAFRTLSPRENSSAAEEAVNEETRTLREANIHVLNYFVDYARDMRNRKFPEESIDQMFWGVMVCYRALREQAKFKGGVLPTLTDEFIEDYNEKDIERIKTMSIDKNITVRKAAMQLGNMELVRFENWEPAFGRIVREKFGLQSDWHPEQDFKYSGIIDLYFLFRAGCSDPKNFQKA